jgi:hypothetical protein
MTPSVRNGASQGYDFCPCADGRYVTIRQHAQSSNDKSSKNHGRTWRLIVGSFRAKSVAAETRLNFRARLATSQSPGMKGSQRCRGRFSGIAESRILEMPLQCPSQRVQLASLPLEHVVEKSPAWLAINHEFNGFNSSIPRKPGRLPVSLNGV